MENININIKYFILLHFKYYILILITFYRNYTDNIFLNTEIRVN